MSSPSPPCPAMPHGIIHINLKAIADNYVLLQEKSTPASVGACVKADAYGLGIEAIAPILATAGCRDFFVFDVAEGVGLRRILGNSDAYRLHVLGGISGGEECGLFLEHALQPVLNTLDDIQRWGAIKKSATDRDIPADIHIDTGMNRLGLSLSQADCLLQDHALLHSINLDCVISHLADADMGAHNGSQNAEQLARFDSISQRFEAAKRRSLANSSGIFLGSAYHYDLVRPGMALYGLNPTPHAPCPMQPVVRYDGRVLQIRCVEQGQRVGYGGVHVTCQDSRLATIGVGYADGFFRALSNKASVCIGRHRAPVVGRVSMDAMVVDVTHIPKVDVQPGMMATVIGGADNHVDILGQLAGSIGYEILTALSRRAVRQYYPYQYYP